MGFWEESSVFLAFLLALIESFRLPTTARNRARLATWSKDTPELKLNLSLLAEAFLQVLASGLGTLALVWATVVLLGGYSTMLVRLDFWYTTAIVFIETARIVGYNSAPEAKFFVDVAAAFSQKNMRVGRTINLVRLLTMGPTWLALAPIFAATACMLLSIIRLVGIAKHGYGSSGTDATNGNLKPALILFYGLVLTQGTLFVLWFAVAMNRSGLAAILGLRYLDHLGRSRRIQIIDRYVDSIEDTCIQKGVYSTINTTLVSFAAELLLQSQDPDDHFSAVLVIHSLVVEYTKRSDKSVEQICSLEKLVYRLVRMLLSEDVDPDIKSNIAEIVAKLACKLRLEDIPGAAHCISSLLDTHLMKEAAQTRRNYDYHFINNIDEKVEIKPLFVHGLVILGELAADPNNCTEMYNTMDLVPKIIAPLSNGLHMVIKNDATTIEIVRESLRVVAKLTRGTGECSRKLCHELTTQYGRTAENILWILSNSDDQDMRMLAVEILSRLTLGAPTMSNFTAELRRLLLDDRQESQLRIEAGKALIARGDEFPDIQQLVTIMSADAYSKEYRAVTAENLVQICAKSKAGQDRDRLSEVANSLSTVLQGISTTDITELDMSNNHFVYETRPKHVLEKIEMSSRKFLASFLGLAVQIREKLVTAQAFADAVTGLRWLPMGNNSFAESLKGIIKVTTNCKSKDEVCLAIMKSTTKLVTWLMEIDTISPVHYMEYFWQDIVRELEIAVEAMAHLERYVVMTGGAGENENYVTLQTLVETAKNKLAAQQLQPPPPQQQQQQQQPPAPSQ